MKKHLGSLALLFVIVVIAIALSVSSIAKPHLAVTETLSVQATPNEVGPQVVAQNPVAGQRLDLSPTIQITFDRAMDQAKTSAAFSLLGPDDKAVSGKATWPDVKTFSFVPDSELQPDSMYRGIFSPSAVALDGTKPADPIELDFTTTESLEVGQVFPTADAEDIDQTTNITVIFNHPVVPLTIKEEQSNLPQPVELSPQVKGQGQWVNSSVYVFQPEQPLLSGIRYTVRVGAGLKDTNGNALEKSFVSQFTTRAAAVASFALKNGAENPPLDNVQNVLLDQAFIITFLQPMNPDSVAGATTVVNRESKTPVSLAFSWNEDFTVLTLAPRGKYNIASYYDLQIAQTAQATDGGTLKDGLTVNFSTVPLPQVVSIVPPSTSQGFDNSLKIQFASPMRVDSLKNRIVITPATTTAPQWYYNDYDNSYSMYDLDPGTNYILRALPGMADIYGNTIQTESSLSFNTADMSPYAQLIVPWTPLVYRAHGPQEMFFEYTNVDSATVSLYPLTFAEFGALASNYQGGKGGSGTSPADFKPQVQPINQWNTNGQVPRNQVNRLDIKLQDQKGNALPPGYYFMGVKGSPLNYTSNFYQGFVFVVATDNITFKSTSTEGLAWVTDLESGQPQANVPVMFYDKDMNQVGKPTSTDQNGLVYLKGIDAPAYARVEGTNHLAFVSTDWGSGVWAGDLGIAQNYYANTNTPFVYLYTDRPVYRPGQDVYFKGLVRQNDDLHYSLLKDTQLYVTIEQSGQQVYAKSLSLSQLGSISDDFKLSDDAALGTYTIFVRTSQTAD
ncbi:MAG TPA: Ig-like domain-containing protein, partial [Anaerolineales bacterium]|nr:Ig-like domain-containing protein [Anaerolineales bacterium]